MKTLTTRQTRLRMLQDRAVARDALKVALEVVDADELLDDMPADDPRLTPDEIWRGWARTARVMPVLDAQLRFLVGKLRTLETPQATAIADLAERLEQRRFQLPPMTGLAQAAAVKSALWLGGFARDMELASIVIEQKLAALQTALDA